MAAAAAAFIPAHEKCLVQKKTGADATNPTPTTMAAEDAAAAALNLAAATDADTPFFSLQGQTLEAKVVDCYDADSLRVVVELHGALVKFAVRIVGLDAPEKRSQRKNERLAARVAHRSMLRTLLGDEGNALLPPRKLTRKSVRRAFAASRRTVTLRCGEFDKYGRLLGKVEVDGGICAGQALVGGGFAHVYDGGTKTPWTDEELNAMVETAAAAAAV